VGLAFLAPLALKRIRHSFLSSLFFFMVGMMTLTKVVVGIVAEAWALLFGNAQIKIGILFITGDMIPNLIQAIIFGIPILLVLFAMFIVIGRKLWKNHYSDIRSRRWFMLYIAISFWIGFGLTIVLI